MTIQHGVNGLIAQTQEEIRSETEASFKAPSPAGFGPDFAVDVPEPLGVMIGIYSMREASLQAAIVGAQNGYRKNSAVGADLDNLADLQNVSRGPETSSTVQLRLAGTPLAALGTSRLVKHVPTDTQWSIPDGTIIGAGGTVDVTGTAVIAGPTPATTSAVDWIVLTVTVGWASVESLTDAILGQIVESNQSLRNSMTAQAAQGKSTQLGMESHLHKLLDKKGVTRIKVFHNPTPSMDARGLPSNSVEVLFEGGTIADLADAVWRSAPAGTELFGSTSTSITDANGDTQAILFSLVTTIDMWVRVTLQTAGAEVALQVSASADVEAAVLEWGLGLDTGHDLIPDLIRKVALAVIPARSVTGTLIELSDDGATWQPTYWPLTNRQRGVLDSARTTVVIT